MRKIIFPLLVATALGAGVLPGLAQSNAAQGAANGADAGGSVLGPVGAVVGGVTGAAVGGAADVAGAVVSPLAPRPGSVKRTTCVTDAAGNKRCDSVQTDN